MAKIWLKKKKAIYSRRHKKWVDNTWDVDEDDKVKLKALRSLGYRKYTPKWQKKKKQLKRKKR